MTPLVTIMSSIVAGMKPTIIAAEVAMARGGSIESVPFKTGDAKKLYVGQKFKVVFAEGTYYTKIVSIDFTALTFTVDLTTAGFSSTPTSVTAVLNYHHGHPAEIVNLFRQATHDQDVKFEQFPAICLFQDIPEKHSVKGKDREARLNMVIITDTDSKYEASQRYTYTFTPTLIPLYERLMDAIECNGDLQILSDDYDYFERIYWGKNGLYGNVGDIFNDFIDAIEINNLRIKTLKN